MSDIKDLTYNASPVGADFLVGQKPTGETYSTLIDDVGAALGTGGGQYVYNVDDTDFTVPANPGTTIVLYTALTGPKTVTLPPASSPSMTVIVKDVNSNVSPTNTITFVPAGADTIEVAIGPLDGPAEMIGYANDGISAWSDISQFTQGVAGFYMALGTVTSTLSVLSGTVAALGDPVSVEHGGTGATTAPDARTNLGLGPLAFVDPASITTTQLGQALIDLGLMAPS